MTAASTISANRLRSGPKLSGSVMTRSPDGKGLIDASDRRPIAPRWDEPGPDDELRDTGIALLGRIPWGSHISMFCETERDLVEAAISFFRPAVRSGEFCVWIVSEPLHAKDVVSLLAKAAPDLDRERHAGNLEIISFVDWYGSNGPADWPGIKKRWREKVSYALEKGFKGLRACGQPSFAGHGVPPNVCEYEHALEAWLADQPIVMLCAYMMGETTPQDLLDVARNHQCVIARRQGQWQFLKTPGSADAKREIRILNGDLDDLPKGYAKDSVLTDRERVVLAQIVKGASSKEAARVLGVSPRTIDFHRANIMQKLAAKNTADLVRKVLADR